MAYVWGEKSIREVLKRGDKIWCVWPLSDPPLPPLTCPIIPLPTHKLSSMPQSIPQGISFWCYLSFQGCGLEMAARMCIVGFAIVGEWPIVIKPMVELGSNCRCTSPVEAEPRMGNKFWFSPVVCVVKLDYTSCTTPLVLYVCSFYIYKEDKRKVL